MLVQAEIVVSTPEPILNITAQLFHKDAINIATFRQ